MISRCADCHFNFDLFRRRWHQTEESVEYHNLPVEKRPQCIQSVAFPAYRNLGEFFHDPLPLGNPWLSGFREAPIKRHTYRAFRNRRNVGSLWVIPTASALRPIVSLVSVPPALPGG